MAKDGRLVQDEKGTESPAVPGWQCYPTNRDSVLQNLRALLSLVLSRNRIAYIDASVGAIICETISEPAVGKMQIETNNVDVVAKTLQSDSFHVREYPRRDLFRSAHPEMDEASNTRVLVRPYSGLARWEVDRIRRHLKHSYGRSGIVFSSMELRLPIHGTVVTPHRESYNEMLLLRAILESGVALVALVDLSATDLSGTHSSFPVCDDDFTWAYACHNRPVLLALVGSENELSTAAERLWLAGLRFKWGNESSPLVLSNGLFIDSLTGSSQR